ncbi:centrosomal protein of 72 kDa [Hypanus sabinus]|uniref:centrosomal protein of 72 kDa n=1 Tax=Hypanus sabinus TaxID=79690 RepID=UPI0028C37BA0|nr:centrosomal protein of 72 kDa [Hypanus sabinus]
MNHKVPKVSPQPRRSILAMWISRLLYFPPTASSEMEWKTGPPQVDRVTTSPSSAFVSNGEKQWHQTWSCVLNISVGREAMELIMGSQSRRLSWREAMELIMGSCPISKLPGVQLNITYQTSPDILRLPDCSIADCKVPDCSIVSKTHHQNVGQHLWREVQRHYFSRENSLGPPSGLIDGPAARLRSEDCFESMALKATEEWVRRRVALEEERLVDVRSLFLPGSCKEKITHLGKSLRNFTRLKILDLSRNSLISLEGIQHLVHLEKLNLYYNNIADLKEIFLLRNLTNLKELDLRLNPVTKNESDYRHFVVHLLPNLRRLDDRPVKDSERKAALMHFSTNQAHEFHEYPAQEAENVRPRHPRAEFVGSLAKKYSELDKDDEAVLNLIAKSNWDMNIPARITGSVKNNPEAELHKMQGLHEIDNARIQESTARNTSQATKSWPVTIPKGVMNSQRKSSVECQALSEDYQSLPNASCPRTYTSTDATAKAGRVTFADEKSQKFSTVDLNLKFQDEAEAYHRVTFRPHFTPHPGYTHNVEGHHPGSSATCNSNGVMPATELKEETQKAENQPAQMLHGHPTAVLKLPGGHLNTTPTTTASCQAEEPHLKRPLVPQRSCGPDHRGSDVSNRYDEKVQSIPCEAQTMNSPIDRIIFNPNLMKNFLDLVDRYWNGFKSLHCNEKFLYQAGKILTALQKDTVKNTSEEITMFQDESNNLKAEVKSLETCLCQQKQRYTEELQSISKQLTQAQRDMKVMKHHLTQTMEEKNQLQNCLIKLEQKSQNVSSSTSQQVEDLQKHNEQLRCEIDSLKHQAQSYIKIQELTEKLQESHRALVYTNEHLLRELNEMRARHKAEVDQLHWSYIQLKKFVEKSTHNTTTTGYTCSGRGMENRRR